jgi:hypothetical protein
MDQRRSSYARRLCGTLLLLGLCGAALAHDRGHGGRGRTTELFVPRSWAGQWSLQVQYRDGSTGQRTAIDDATGVICPGDLFGLSSFVPKRREHGGASSRERTDGLRSGCDGAVRGGGFELQCWSRYRQGGCRVDAELSLRAQRQEGALAGTGDWRVTDTEGDCEAVLQHASLGETIELSGVRVGSDLAGCSAPPASLVEKLVSHMTLVALLPRPIAGLRAQTEGCAVHLRWDPIAGAAAYEVLRATEGRPFARVALRSAARGPHYRDDSVRAGHLYRYVVRWLDSDGRLSPASDEATAAPAAR